MSGRSPGPGSKKKPAATGNAAALALTKQGPMHAPRDLEEEPAATPSTRPSSCARASGLMAGGSLLGLAAATSLGAYQRSLDLDYRFEPALGLWLTTLLSARPLGAPCGVWLGVTLVSIAVGACLVREAALPTRGQRVAMTALSLACAAIVVLAFALTLVALELPPPRLQEDALVWIIAGAGGLLAGPAIRAAWAKAVDRRYAAKLESQAEGLEVAAPSPDELRERIADEDPSATTVEVRVLWGGDPLRVQHLDPSRGFSVREGLARVVGTPKGDAKVIATRGASGFLVTREGSRVSIDRAIEAGLAEMSREGIEVPLRKGARVTVAIAPPPTGAAYRGSDIARGTSSSMAALVIEVALVSRPRGVGRAPVLPRARALGGFAVAASMLGGPIVGGWANESCALGPPNGPDDPTEEAIAELRTQLQRAAAHEEPEEPPPPVDPVVAARAAALLESSWNTIGLLTIQAKEDKSCGFVHEHAPLSQRVVFMCDPVVRWGVRYADLLEGVGEANDGVVPVGPREPWEADRPRFFARQRASVWLRAGAVEVQGRVREDLVRRVVHQSFGQLRACYDDARRVGKTRVPATIHVRFVIGADGRTSSVTVPDLDWDSPPEGCLARSFRSLSFPPSTMGASVVTYEILTP